MQEKKTEKKVIKISLKKIILLIVFIWGLSIWGTWQFASSRISEYPLLNPRLATFGLDTPEKRDAKMFATLSPLNNELVDTLGDKKPNIAFYVEDLNTGSWTGWQEKEPFIAASILKVPVAIGVMKKVDSGDWDLDTTFTLEAKFKDSNFGELYNEADGTQLSVDRLMHEMLENSDNTAVAIFLDKLTVAERDDVFYHIGVNNPEENGAMPKFAKLSAKNLASMFRALFNSTYLPQHPYLYCLMTKTYNADEAEKIIPDLGDKIYDYFSKAGKT